MPWEENSAKYHVEDGEDYNGEKRRHLYMIVTIYYINLSFSLSESLSPTTRSKNEMKIQKKRKKYLH